MKVTVPNAGGIAESIQGRDAGTLYVICSVQGNDVFVADGVRRKLENPKKKNVKHLRLLPQAYEHQFDKAFDCNAAHLLKRIKENRHKS